MSHGVKLAVFYSILIFGASLLGGYIPRWIRLTHSRMQTAISFVAGVILGIGLLHLIPHAYYELGSLDQTMVIVLVGFLAMFFLQRIFHFHTHEVWDGSEDAPAEVPSPAPENSLPVIQSAAVEHVHGPDCNHGPHDHGHHHYGHGHHDHDHMFPTGSWTWAGVFFGLALHSLIDGLALGAAIQAEGDEHSAPLFAGIGYFLAVFLHKPFDSISITSLMHMTGWSRKSSNNVNWIYALVAPLGVLIFFLSTGVAGNVTGWMGGMLAFAAGACVCIATSDLLPELQFHSHDRLRLSIALIAGLAMAWALVFIESQGHDHHSHGNPASQQLKNLHIDRKDHGHKDHDHKH